MRKKIDKSSSDPIYSLFCTHNPEKDMNPPLHKSSDTGMLQNFMKKRTQ